MSLKTGNPPTIKNNLLHKLPLPGYVIDRVEQIPEQEGAKEYLEFNDWYDNKIKDDEISEECHEIAEVENDYNGFLNENDNHSNIIFDEKINDTNSYNDDPKTNYEYDVKDNGKHGSDHDEQNNDEDDNV